MTIGLGFQDQYLDNNTVERVVQAALSGLALDGKRVLGEVKKWQFGARCCLGFVAAGTIDQNVYLAERFQHQVAGCLDAFFVQHVAGNADSSAALFADFTPKLF